MVAKVRGLIFCVFCVTLLFVLMTWQDQRSIYRTATGLSPLQYIFTTPVIDTAAQIKFWRALEFTLTSNGPGIPRPDQNGSQPDIYYNANEDYFFPELITMDEEQVAAMKKGHESYVKATKVQELNPVYNKGTRGIVCTAGGSYLPLVAVALRILKRLGSKLPMEVFLEAGEEYESYVCEKIFPAFNARCVILSEILNAVPHPVAIEHFQLKYFALLFSSFEEVLFLDADSFPVHNPQVLFDSEPYKSTGMVLWPDFWYATPSEHFFEITSSERPPSSLRQSSESGEILINKRTHKRTLLMAAYYNYYGPEHYYPLLAQGGPGEGDKETFLPAAEIAGDLVYQVSEKIVAIGHSDGQYLDGSAMVQFHPADDFYLVSQGLLRTKQPAIAPSPRPFFIHVNRPKFNPGRVYDEWGLLHWQNGTMRRAWIDEASTMALFDIDAEKMYWEESKWVACNLEDRFRDWYGLEDVCKKATGYWEAMFEH